MVESKDIQLGNYFGSAGRTFRVDYIGPKREGYSTDVKEYYIDEDGSESYNQSFNENLGPLPINPQLLGDLGFSEGFDWTENHFTHALARGFVLVFNKTKWQFGKYVEGGFCGAYIPLKDVSYVHDVQNLIYELTKNKIKWKE